MVERGFLVQAVRRGGQPAGERPVTGGSRGRREDMLTIRCGSSELEIVWPAKQRYDLIELMPSWTLGSE